MARRRLSAEEKLQLVVESFRREISIAELCRRVDIWPTELNRFRARVLEGALEALKNSSHRKKDPGWEELLVSDTHHRPLFEVYCGLGAFSHLHGPGCEEELRLHLGRMGVL